MLETELKALLTENQYNTLLNMFEINSSNEQTNSYYIAPDNVLKKQGITFRIRTINGTHKIQVKKHTGKHTALQIAEETEYDISQIPESFTEEDIFKLTGIKTTASLIGELTTLRNSCMYCDGVEICIDKSTYLGCTDYEIEIEYTKPVPDELLRALAEKADVRFDKPCTGKFSRFLNRLLG